MGVGGGSCCASRPPGETRAQTWEATECDQAGLGVRAGWRPQAQRAAEAQAGGANRGKASALGETAVWGWAGVPSLRRNTRVVLRKGHKE